MAARAVILDSKISHLGLAETLHFGNLRKFIVTVAGNLLIRPCFATEIRGSAGRTSGKRAHPTK